MLLHIIPNTAIDKNYADTGGTKGIKIFYDFFKSNRIDYEDLVAPDRSDIELLALLKETDLSKYTDVFIHYTSFLRSIKYIKRNYPNINVIVRSHNAEFPHWLHHSVSWLKFGNVIEAVKLFLISFLKLRGDFVSCRVADYVLVITPWELAHYWKYFPKKCNLIYVPFYSAETPLGGNGVEVLERELTCTCLLSTNISPFLIDAAQNFQRLVKGLDGRLPEWTFKISGNNDGIKRGKNENVEFTGIVDDPVGLQKNSKVIAVLSDYGFGFKTKILEAIENGCFVLVSKKLFFRLPLEVRKNCLEVDVNDIESFERALIGLETKIAKKSNVNRLLKATAFKNLLPIVSSSSHA
jgi:hypothetical protein